MPRPVIALLTDFGMRDHYVGTMKGVALGICPDVTLVDISHDVPRARRRRPARSNWPRATAISRPARCFSSSSIRASARRAAAIAAEAGEYRFVGARQRRAAARSSTRRRRGGWSS